MGKSAQALERETVLRRMLAARNAASLRGLGLTVEEIIVCKAADQEDA